VHCCLCKCRIFSISSLGIPIAPTRLNLPSSRLSPGTVAAIVVVRGPEVDDLEDTYEDKPPGDKSRQPTHAGTDSESLSFSLDLPIQPRPPIPPSRRDYSGNGAQELPHNPTASLDRTGTHRREPSRGVPLHEISVAGDGVDKSTSLILRHLMHVCRQCQTLFLP
jgi:hypothetical protein